MGAGRRARGSLVRGAGDKPLGLGNGIEFAESMLSWACRVLTSVVGRTCRVVARVLAVGRETPAAGELTARPWGDSPHDAAEFLAGHSQARVACQWTKRMRPALANGMRQLMATLLSGGTLVSSAMRSFVRLWKRRWSGASRPDVWESVGGHAEISPQASKVADRCALGRGPPGFSFALGDPPVAERASPASVGHPVPMHVLRQEMRTSSQPFFK